jgi:hypothetical protein
VIPKECRLDIYIDETIPDRVTQIEYVLAGSAQLAPLQIFGVGYAAQYKNITAAAHPALVNALESRLNALEGVFVNCYPPEIEADLQSDQEAL